MRSAKSWQQLHEELAKVGVSYERRGSGAWLRRIAEEETTKASTVGRDLSLGALQKRLGLFAGGEGATTSKASPLNGVPSLSWRDFQAAKEEHYKAKAAETIALAKAHDLARTALRDAQRARKEALRAEANHAERAVRRNVLAWQHAGERADLRERLARERAELRARFAPFPRFDDWLRRAGERREADEWRHRLSEDPAPAPKDIRAFAPAVSGTRVMYRRKNGQAPAKDAAFIDQGRAVQVRAIHDEGAVLASLQLAAAKWGRVRVAGGDAQYRALVGQLAEQHGLWIVEGDQKAAAATGAASGPSWKPRPADHRAPPQRAAGASWHSSFGERPPATTTPTTPPERASKAQPAVGPRGPRDNTPDIT